MPKLFTSFTGTLRELKSGSITAADLAQGYFAFGCDRSHAIAPWKHSTNEIEWFWRNDPDEGRRVHAQLVSALMDAELQDRVVWRTDTTQSVWMFLRRYADGIGAEVIR